MSDPTEVFVVDQDYTMLDSMIWRRHRRRTPGLVEKTLELNPGLADLGPILPIGTRVLIPLDRPNAVTTLPLVKLWD
jgi:phage tail protein X